MRIRRSRTQVLPCLLLLFGLLCERGESWLSVPSNIPRAVQRIPSEGGALVSRTLLAAKKQSRSTKDPSLAVLEEEEKTADVVGAQFFGGNKEKEEFYDPVAEAEAGQELVLKETLYDRFAQQAAFPDNETAALARTLQNQISSVLYEGIESTEKSYNYASNLQWETPFSVSASQPLQALEQALEFYRRLDLAITCGERVKDNQFKLRWEISVSWPIFWEPRVLLTGTSTLTLQDNQIVEQVDTLDADLLSSVRSQIFPRFWDLYHVGMTPSAELLPKLPVNKSPFSRYRMYDIPPRLVLQPSMMDLGDREDGSAGIIPNHAFSCVIKTMGPQRQRYIPTSPVEVKISPTTKGPLALTWSIPISVECVTNPQLLIPGPDEEANEETEPACSYQWQGPRKVATIEYGGRPQDPEIAELRKALYERVTKDGLAPKLDESGRPIFFFWQNSAKACYTEEGLGMAVYEWRPEFVKSNEIGIELEL